MLLDPGAWASHIRIAPVEECAELYSSFSQLAAIAASRLFLHRPVQKTLDGTGRSERRLLTLPETARLLRVSEYTAREWGRSGRIPTVRIGRRVLVDPSAIEAMVNGRSSHHT